MQSRVILLPKRLRFLFPFSWSGLRARMALAYVSVTLGSVLSFLLLTVLASGALSAVFSDSLDSNFLTVLQRQAQSYAQIAALQAQGETLDPHTSFIPGQAHTLALPNQENLVYPVFAPSISTASPDPKSVFIALLIAPDGHLVASSYPSRYSAGMSISALLPEQRRAIGQALAGQASTGTEHLSSITLEYAAEPVWSKDHQPIGTIFLQVPRPEGDNIFSRLGSALLSNIVLLILVIPIGVFFGRVTTRHLVQRVQQLVLATTQFAGGDYTQRVSSRHQDEIGQLERQFNQMAEQLVENIARRQQLAEQNARLQERSRISRELHDAISQDLFSLRMLADGLQEATRAGSSSTDLRPPTQLENLGLAGALRKLAQAYSMRLGITVTTDVKPIALDVKTEHALLRIAQESLANAARHSSATLISLCLVSEGSRVKLTITDNGEGFAANEGVEGHGLGLHVMQERVEELHGTFDLKTVPGQGTCITVDVPRENACD